MLGMGRGIGKRETTDPELAPAEHLRGSTTRYRLIGDPSAIGPSCREP